MSQVNVVFLDVDGVLNHDRGYKLVTKDGLEKYIQIPGTYDKGIVTKNGYKGIEDQFVENLKQIVDSQENVQIVLSSDWKNDFTDDMQPVIKDGEPDAESVYLIEKLEQHGLHLAGKTSDKSSGIIVSSGRGAGIRQYLATHNVRNYVILDDWKYNDFTNELLSHFVHTDNTEGLTKTKAQKAIEILNCRFF